MEEISNKKKKKKERERERERSKKKKSRKRSNSLNENKIKSARKWQSYTVQNAEYRIYRIVGDMV